MAQQKLQILAAPLHSICVGRMCGLNSFIILFYFFPQFLGRIQEVLKPLNRILGVSLELVLIIHKEETKP